MSIFTGTKIIRGQAIHFSQDRNGKDALDSDFGWGKKKETRLLFVYKQMKIDGLTLLFHSTGYLIPSPL
jgi:hypothetical protein